MGMSNADPIAELIPWYANGTLDAAEREKVENHLPGCPSCYALLARARSFRRLAPGAAQEGLLEHVSGHLLVQFAEHPDRLEAGTRRFISLHLSDCQVCAGALEILQGLAQEPIEMEDPGDAERARRGARSSLVDSLIAFWRGLTRSVLGPVPALVYLGALVLVVSTVLMRAPGGGGTGMAGSGVHPMTAIAVLPPVVRLPEEIAMRGGDARPAPQEVALPGAAGPVLLELVTSIDLEDLSDPGASFRVEIAAGDGVVGTLTLHGSDFDRRGRLQLMLDRDLCVTGIATTVRIVFVKEGDSGNGDEVYRKSVRWVETGKN